MWNALIDLLSPGRRPGESFDSGGFRRQSGPRAAVGVLAPWLLAVLLLLGLSGCETRPVEETPAPDLAYSLEARAAMGAHHLCAGLWVVGREYRRTPEEVVAQDIAVLPNFGWRDEFAYEVDEGRRRVTVTPPGAPPRTAVYHGDQGCTILPRGETAVFFEPVPVPRSIPDPATHPWPTGDLGAVDPEPQGVDLAALAVALNWALAQEGQNTRALVVAWQGRIVGEAYAPGWSPETPQVGWSQGKSITAALVGILVRDGHFGLDDPAPVPEWQGADDPRREIRVRHLLNMSSGLDFKNLSLQGPESFVRENDHMRIYFDALDVFHHAVHRPLELPPGSEWRYRNSDPLTLGKILRETVEARGEAYLTFPQRALFDPIGARNFVLEPDAWGNFILTGYDFGSARDWLRFGLLHLWDGVWEGKRILPEGWVEFVSTPAPADPNRGYGGLFWVNRGGHYDRVPEDAYWAAGAFGQTTLIVPSRDLVVVRLGPSTGAFREYFNEVMGRILEALPAPPGGR